MTSTSPVSSSRFRTASCSRPHTPARDQLRNLRWTVDFETPKHGGRARQAHPLTSTVLVRASPDGARLPLSHPATVEGLTSSTRATCAFDKRARCHNSRSRPGDGSTACGPTTASSESIASKSLTVVLPFPVLALAVRRRAASHTPASGPPDHPLELLPQPLGIRPVLTYRQVRADQLPLLVGELPTHRTQRPIQVPFPHGNETRG